MRLYVLARPSFDSSQAGQFLEDEGLSWLETPTSSPAEQLTEFSGRICYMSFGKGRQSPKTNSEYIRHLVSQGHESVLEHCSWTFLLAGVSRAFSHQLVRHRVGFSYSQLSQQYHDESEAEFVEPDNLRLVPKAFDAWKRATEAAKAAYSDVLSALADDHDSTSNTALDKKELLRSMRSAARSVLPNATETKIVFTANGRSIRHFLAQRGSILGDEEMRRACAAIARVISEDAPSLIADFYVEQLGDGSPIVSQRPSR